jgi:hypothetical protein
MQRKWYKVTR